jgi:hypothetical protein
VHCSGTDVQLEVRDWFIRVAVVVRVYLRSAMSRCRMVEVAVVGIAVIRVNLKYKNVKM